MSSSKLPSADVSVLLNRDGASPCVLDALINAAAVDPRVAAALDMGLELAGDRRASGAVAGDYKHELHAALRKLLAECLLSVAAGTDAANRTCVYSNIQVSPSRCTCVRYYGLTSSYYH